MLDDQSRHLQTIVQVLWFNRSRIHHLKVLKSNEHGIRYRSASIEDTKFSEVEISSTGKILRGLLTVLRVTALWTIIWGQ